MAEDIGVSDRINLAVVGCARHSPRIQDFSSFRILSPPHPRPVFVLFMLAEGKGLKTVSSALTDPACTTTTTYLFGFIEVK